MDFSTHITQYANSTVTPSLIPISAMRTSQMLPFHLPCKTFQPGIPVPNTNGDRDKKNHDRTEVTLTPTELILAI